jgi:hypothetical protein
VSDQICPREVHLIAGLIVGICLLFGIIEPLHCLLRCSYGGPRFLLDFRHPGCKFHCIFSQHLKVWFSALPRMEPHGHKEGAEPRGLANLVVVVEFHKESTSPVLW